VVATWADAASGIFAAAPERASRPRTRGRPGFGAAIFAPLLGALPYWGRKADKSASGYRWHTPFQVLEVQ
jgi:hypothetical protein